MFDGLVVEELRKKLRVRCRECVVSGIRIRVLGGDGRRRGSVVGEASVERWGDDIEGYLLCCG